MTSLSTVLEGHPNPLVHGAHCPVIVENVPSAHEIQAVPPTFAMNAGEQTVQLDDPEDAAMVLIGHEEQVVDPAELKKPAEQFKQALLDVDPGAPTYRPLGQGVGMDMLPEQ